MAIKLKRVGSKDGKPDCCGCHFHNKVNNYWTCVQPTKDIRPCVRLVHKVVRYEIFVEDKDESS